MINGYWQTTWVLGSSFPSEIGTTGFAISRSQIPTGSASALQLLHVNLETRGREGHSARASYPATRETGHGNSHPVMSVRVGDGRMSDSDSLITPGRDFRDWWRATAAVS